MTPNYCVKSVSRPITLPLCAQWRVCECLCECLWLLASMSIPVCESLCVCVDVSEDILLLSFAAPISQGGRVRGTDVESAL